MVGKIRWLSKPGFGLGCPNQVNLTHNVKSSNSGSWIWNFMFRNMQWLSKPGFWLGCQTRFVVVTMSCCQAITFRIKFEMWRSANFGGCQNQGLDLAVQIRLILLTMYSHQIPDLESGIWCSETRSGCQNQVDLAVKPGLSWLQCYVVKPFNFELNLKCDGRQNSGAVKTRVRTWVSKSGYSYSQCMSSNFGSWIGNLMIWIFSGCQNQVFDLAVKPGLS